MFELVSLASFGPFARKTQYIVGLLFSLLFLFQNKVDILSDR